ncbi:response regulator transcription factor [Herbaspirillum sp. RV1423]|uniref:response regulator transcription factor n=1 Tax=Herbaspirillum sp. RV1423 TaxID=1443993 RepID=UPI000554551D|nr:response regulator transcription factor [Herbaspirillum sp. RV1423]
MRIAILEDEPAEAALVQHILTGAGHNCTLYDTGTQLIDALGSRRFDLLVLDWMLPDMTGHDVVNWVRSHLSAQVLVLFLSNRALEENIVLALMAGGDDYMIKPARRAELLARVHALSRRLPAQESEAAPPSDDKLEVGAYRFNRILKQASLHGKAIELKPKEFDIAFALFRNVGGIVSREQLTEEVWGRDLVMTSRTLDTHMSNVRSKLALKPENQVKLTTIYTLGYRLDCLDGEAA